MLNYDGSTYEIADALTNLVRRAIIYGNVISRSYGEDRFMAKECDKISKLLGISWKWADNKVYPIFFGNVTNYTDIIEPPEDNLCEFCREVNCTDCEHMK